MQYWHDWDLYFLLLAGFKMLLYYVKNILKQKSDRSFEHFLQDFSNTGKYFQNHLLWLLTHNMTKDCSMDYKFST